MTQVVRSILVLCVLAAFAACDSTDGSSSSPNASSSSGGTVSCPDLAGTWTVTAHCDASLIGQTAVVAENDCHLTFAAPFDGFTGTVGTDGKLSVTGPQSCTGTSNASSLSMSCTPGACSVSLTR